MEISQNFEFSMSFQFLCGFPPGLFFCCLWPPVSIPTIRSTHLLPLYFFLIYCISKDKDYKASQQSATQPLFSSLHRHLSPSSRFLLLPLSYQNVSLHGRLQYSRPPRLSSYLYLLSLILFSAFCSHYVTVKPLFLLSLDFRSTEPTLLFKC